MEEYKVKVYDDKTVWCNLGGRRHREGGPSVETVDGDKFWYINGEFHREDGPAIECADGAKSWWINGKRHREDGPACEYVGGNNVWYIDGKELTEDEFNNRNVIEMTIADIEQLVGKKVKIVSKGN